MFNVYLPAHVVPAFSLLNDTMLLLLEHSSCHLSLFQLCMACPDESVPLLIVYVYAHVVPAFPLLHNIVLLPHDHPSCHLYLFQLCMDLPNETFYLVLVYVYTHIVPAFPLLHGIVLLPPDHHSCHLYFLQICMACPMSLSPCYLFIIVPMFSLLPLSSVLLFSFYPTIIAVISECIDTLSSDPFPCAALEGGPCQERCGTGPCRKSCGESKFVALSMLLKPKAAVSSTSLPPSSSFLGYPCPSFQHWWSSSSSSISGRSKCAASPSLPNFSFALQPSVVFSVVSVIFLSPPSGAAPSLARWPLTPSSCRLLLNSVALNCLLLLITILSLCLSFNFLQPQFRRLLPAPPPPDCSLRPERGGADFIPSELA